MNEPRTSGSGMLKIPAVDIFDRKSVQRALNEMGMEIMRRRVELEQLEEGQKWLARLLESETGGTK